MTHLSLSRPSRRASRQRGFTLIETMVTVGIAGVLSSIAYPSLEGQVMRARRSDALVALLQAQLAQERFRANNASYGTSPTIGVRADVAGGPLPDRRSVRAPPPASSCSPPPSPRQARDASCRHLRLASPRAASSYASGPDATTANGADANRACWSR